MIALGWRLLCAGGWGRPALLAACTAVVSGLLLVAVALLNIRGYADEQLWSVAADPGTRGGMVFAVVMLGLPPLLLLHQAVRLGTAARERRLAALRLAGATPADVRRIGAVEVGVPALAGGVLGVGVYWFLRTVFSGLSMTVTEMGFEGSSDELTPFVYETSLRLVPTTVGPMWWQYLLVVLAVAGLGIAAGALAGRGVTVTPLGVTRRTPGPPPRPWGFVLIAAGAAAGATQVWFYDAIDSTVVGVAAVALMVLGMVVLSSWTAHRVGAYAAARAQTADVLLAARRLATDPRPAGRAAAAVGGISLVAGGTAGFLADVNAAGEYDPVYSMGAYLVLGLLVVALLVVVGSLAVHSVESLLDRRRPMAALAALGTPLDVMLRAQRWEARLVALPMTVAGVLLGAGLYGAAAATGDGAGRDAAASLALVVLAVLLAAVLLVALAVEAAVRLTRPWARAAASPANLRTE